MTSIDLEPDIYSRQRAVTALGVLADQRAIDVLLKLVNEEEHALQEFAARKSRKPMVHASAVERLEREKARLEQTIIEQSVELSLLKKSENGI